MRKLLTIAALAATVAASAVPAVAETVIIKHRGPMHHSAMMHRPHRVVVVHRPMHRPMNARHTTVIVHKS